MDIEDAIEYLDVWEMNKNSDCDYCDEPEGRRFIRYDRFEWMNQAEGRKVRSIKSGDDWGSKYDDQPVDEIIKGEQHQIHYYVCETCLVRYANMLYDQIGRCIGNEETWMRKYFGDSQKTREIRKHQVGVSVEMEKVW